VRKDRELIATGLITTTPIVEVIVAHRARRWTTSVYDVDATRRMLREPDPCVPNIPSS
jgi:hypothetical protein